MHTKSSLFVCWWTFKWFPCLGYLTSAAMNIRGMCVFLNDSCAAGGQSHHNVITQWIMLK